jgi:hypothetical protein
MVNRVKVESKNKAKPRMKLSPEEFRRKYLKIAIVIFICAVLVGSAHGFYASVVRDMKHHTYFGSELCNGEIVSGKILAGKSDKAILMYYQLHVLQGTASLKIFGPGNNLISEFNDWEDILRQKAIRIDESKEGIYTFSLSCEKAEINYDLRFDVE